MSGRRPGARRVAGLALWLLAGGLLVPLGVGRACGVCDADKIAATYDFAVVSRAEARHHRVLFAALEGPVAVADPGLARRLARTLERATGADAGTARVSLSPAAVSLAYDPARTSRTTLAAALSRALVPRGLRLRVIDAGMPPASAGVAPGAGAGSGAEAPYFVSPASSRASSVPRSSSSSRIRSSSR